MMKIKKNMENPIIELKNVTKEYKMGKNKLVVLRDINLKIYKGELVIILGASGSGKSTLMNIIGCLDVPTTGNLYLSGKDVSKFSEKKLSKLRGENIGFIFQQFNLIPSLSALKNVMLPLEFLNYNYKIAKINSQKILTDMELKDRMDHKPTELSGGQQQRVAISRALITNPDIILADEPTGNLDSKTGLYILDFLKKLNKEGKTIILVTHDPKIINYGNKTIHIVDGKIQKIE